MSEKVLLVAEVDEYLREAAGDLFYRNGMNTSTAINLYLSQVVATQQIPLLSSQQASPMFKVREYDSKQFSKSKACKGS